jgi:general stress protein 26
MERKELEAIASEIMGRADMLSLATMAEEPYPYVRALFNLRNKRKFPSLAPFFAGKGLAVYLGTNTSSIKMAQIGNDGWVSVYYMIPREFKGLCLSGRAIVDADAKEAIWVKGWERYYPSGKSDPDYTVLRVEPVRARGWYTGKPFDIAL